MNDAGDVGPRLARLLARRLLPRRLHEPLIGDLEQTMRRGLATGAPPAPLGRRYLWQVLGAVVRRPAPLPHRDRRTGDGPMGTLRHDLTFALRSVRRRAGFAALIAITLALGIGATTAIFSVVDTVLLRPLPFAEPERLVLVHGRDAERLSGRFNNSYPDFQDLRAGVEAFADLAAWSNRGHNLTGAGAPPQQVQSAAISHNLFAVLGVEPLYGRGFSPEEDAPGGAPVAMLSYGLWQSRFGGDPGIVERTVTINGVDHAVVGVLPAGRQFPAGAQLFLPLGVDADLAAQRGRRVLRLLARLAPGTDPRQASAESAALAARLARQHPRTNRGHSVWAEPLHAGLVRGVRGGLGLLFGAVVLVLAIACANVAGLLLVRAIRRGREVATRGALGAGTWQLVRLFLAESLVLGALGAALGAAVAGVAVVAIRHLAPADVPRIAEIALDQRALGFAAVIALAACLVCGAAPLVEVRRRALVAALRAGGTGGDAPRRRRLRQALAVTQIALAITLVIGAGLLLRTLGQLAAVDSGVRDQGVLSVTLQRPTPFAAAEPAAAADVRFFEQLLARLDAMPGVEGVTAAYHGPYDPGWTLPFALDDRPPPAGGDEPQASYRPVVPGYFRTLEIPLRAGRALSPLDGADAAPVAVVNEAFARAFFGDRSPLGTGLAIPHFWRRATVTYRIVGVVGDVRFAGLDQGAEPAFYFAHAQQPVEMLKVLLTTGGDPFALLPGVRQAVWALDDTQALAEVTSLRAERGELVSARRFLLGVLGAFAALATALAAVGLYGVLAHAVSSRRREIGVRMALGAGAGAVLRAVLAEGLLMASGGLALGLLAAAVLSRWLASQLFGVAAVDPVTYAAVALFLFLVALAATLAPALRASRVDPIEALRQE